MGNCWWMAIPGLGAVPPVGEEVGALISVSCEVSWVQFASRINMGKPTVGIQSIGILEDAFKLPAP